MKICRVCGNQYENEAQCPRCGYTMVDLYIGGIGNPEQEAAEYRDHLLRSIEVSIELFDKHVPDENGEYLIPNGKVTRSLGTAFAGTEKLLWLKEPICAVSEQYQSVEVPVQISRNGSVRSLRIPMPVLPEHELLQLGVEVIREHVSGRLHMKNNSEEVVSEEFSLL